MKKILILSIFSLLAILVFAHNGQSKTKAYYSGDAVSFNDDLYVSSTNSGNLEVFKLENNSLDLVAKTKVFNDRYNRYDDFFDSKFNVENNHLYIYAVNGYSLYKYEVVDDSQLVLVVNQSNTYWEWYNRVDKFGDNITTISASGVKIWNKDLQVIDSYSFNNKKEPYNIRANSLSTILNVQDNHLIAYDRTSRTNLISIPLNYKTITGNRQAYQDESNNLFVVDDYYAKKFNLEGKLLGSFKHINQPGFDVSASGRSEFIYFSNGLGVVKLNKETMEESTYAWTSSLGGSRGWAMGLKAVYSDGSEKVVVFNNSNILVLNNKLKKIASFTAIEEDAVYSSENLFLRLDSSFGSVSTNVELNGGGYFPNEKLIINFAGVISNTKTDNRGRFTQTLLVPSVPANSNNGGVDIKVDGENSKLSYSISYKIIK